MQIPLTQLPGNVPINEHIDRLLENKTPFHACYFDIDNFKPFNDIFGYRKGDDLIMWLSHTLREIISPGADFCGHIGGDDFMVLFQSTDWESRCQKALRMFEFQVSEYLQSGLKKDKGYYTEDRRGQRIFSLHSAINRCHSNQPRHVRVTPRCFRCRCRGQKKC